MGQKSNYRYLISAYNIHGGGGGNLLRQLLKALPLERAALFLDSRFEFKDQAKEMERVPKSIFARILAEWKIKKKAHEFDICLFFGNLPPLFKNKSFNVLFVQNKYLTTNFTTKEFRLFVRFRIFLERMWLRFFLKNVQLVVVQTAHMQKSFYDHFGHRLKVIVLPFCDELSLKNQGTLKAQAKRFIYVSSGEPHKNHRRLLKAWEMFIAEHPDCELTLTLDGQNTFESPQGVRHLGRCSHDEILNTYQSNDCLIFPSLLESFGLPLIEAMQGNMRILASDLDYVYELLKPDLAFNPYDENDILSTLRKAYRGDFDLVQGERVLSLKLLSAKEFIQGIESSYDQNI
jgi:glycosyltransferase involved in cell wall biosynthesis